jgi:FkbH-like protein
VTARKCLVWDLDDTLWDGVCLEGEVTVRDEARRTIGELDRRGVLHSIASRGDHDVAVARLRENGLDGYFLAPRVNWLPKPTNLVAIARDLGIAVEALAFVDDDAFERAQVAHMLPGVAVFDAAALGDLPHAPEFSDAEPTPEARERRHYYRSEIERRDAEARCASREDFLASCRMRLVVRRARASDVPRIVELMSRTHQLNTTGVVFSADEVRSLVAADGRSGAGRSLRVAELADCFGPYGTIGVALIDERGTARTLEYFALSCRVLGRGVERAFFAAVTGDAAARADTGLEALLRDTGRNRAMRALYQMIGLREGPPRPDGTSTFRAQPGWVPAGSPWVEVTCGSC